MIDKIKNILIVSSAVALSRTGGCPNDKFNKEFKKELISEFLKKTEEYLKSEKIEEFEEILNFKK